MYIPWSDTYQGAEEVIIAIQNLRNDRGLKLAIQPKFFWFAADNEWQKRNGLKSD